MAKLCTQCGKPVNFLTRVVTESGPAHYYCLAAFKENQDQITQPPRPVEDRVRKDSENRGKGGKYGAVAWLILSQFAAIVTAFILANYASDLANFLSWPGEFDGFIATMWLIITIAIVVSWVLFGRGKYGLACLASSIPLLLYLSFIG